MKIDPKKKSMICRMAGNIAGSMFSAQQNHWHLSEASIRLIADDSVALAMMICDIVEKKAVE